MAPVSRKWELPWLGAKALYISEYEFFRLQNFFGRSFDEMFAFYSKNNIVIIETHFYHNFEMPQHYLREIVETQRHGLMSGLFSSQSPTF